MKRILGFFAWLFGSVQGHALFFKGITTLLLAAGAVAQQFHRGFLEIPIDKGGVRQGCGQRLQPPSTSRL